MHYQNLEPTKHEEYKKFGQSNKFKITGTIWDKEFELCDESYSLSDIRDYFKYTIKKHETLTDKPPAQLYVSKIEIRITFKI